MFFNKKRIKVTVKPYGIVKNYVNGGTFELKEGAKLRTLLRKSGANGIAFPLILMINGERVKPSQHLNDGDEVKLLNIVGGG
jgi:sulfur carrier protein ThiS